MCHEIINKKKAIRRLMAEESKRKSPVYFQKANASIVKQVLMHHKIKEAKCILSYWSMPLEAGTISINNTLFQQKTILLPVIHKNNLVLKQFCGVETMKTEAKYGILEPQGEEFTAYDKIDVVIVPGVAFSKTGQRCGHGKGYYDRLLPKLKNARKIGLAFDFQIADQIPTDSFDVLLNEVIIA